MWSYNLTVLGFIGVILLLLPRSRASSEIHLNLILGSSQIISCKSSYPPPWTKISPSKEDVKIIGVNGEKHSGWTEPRYTFSKNGSHYLIQISEVRLSDAGKLICGSDESITFVITVLR